MKTDIQPLAPPAVPRPETVIRPGMGGLLPDVVELWRYRELFWALTWRTILIRYKQTVVGVLWAVIRPVLLTIVSVVLFSRIAGLPAEGMPYSVMALAGVLVWQLFANGLQEGTNTMVANAGMIGKIYFPRLILPTSACLAGLVDFAVSAVVLVLWMAVKGVVPTWRIVLLPVFVVLAFVIALGVCFWLAALMVRYRDVRHVVPFLLQFGLFATPVMYATSAIGEKWRLVFSALNPLVGVIDGIRWSIAPHTVAAAAPPFHGDALLISLGLGLALLFAGMAFFKRMERTFADFI